MAEAAGALAFTEVNDMHWGWQAPDRPPHPGGRPAPDAVSMVRSEPDASLLRRFAVAVGVQDLVLIAARDDAMRRLDVALRLLA